MKALFLFTFYIVLVSCASDKKDGFIEQSSNSRTYTDNFEDTIAKFWKVNQISHPDRLQIVQDPLNPDNGVLKISLEKDDRMAGGFRNELSMRSKDSFGYRNKYSYRFMFPESFFKKEDKKGIIVLNQWHDEPYPGFNWNTKKIKAKPPYAMYVEHNKEGEFYMVMHSGIRVGTVDELTLSRWPGKLEPNKWYDYEVEIFWSLYEDGYVKAKINDTCFQIDGKEQCTFTATNMYHKLPNYFKMGLYWSKGHEHTRSIYYDDFKMTTERIGYFAPKNLSN